MRESYENLKKPEKIPQNYLTLMENAAKIRDIYSWDKTTETILNFI